MEQYYLGWRSSESAIQTLKALKTHCIEAHLTTARYSKVVGFEKFVFKLLSNKLLSDLRVLFTFYCVINLICVYRLFNQLNSHMISTAAL